MTPASARARLLQLLKQLSYEEREVILASGKPSNFYIDCKQTVLTAEGHFLVGTIISDLLANAAPDVRAVGGLTMGADPLASAVATGTSDWDRTGNAIGTEQDRVRDLRHGRD